MSPEAPQQAMELILDIDNGIYQDSTVKHSHSLLGRLKCGECRERSRELQWRC
jgi:hypothetical protein